MEFQIINGQIVSSEEAKIPLNDLGLLRSYSVFDYFRVLEGVPVFIEDHIDRLLGSASQMHLDHRWNKEELIELCADLIAANNATDASIRIVITGGFSEDGYSPAEPNLYATMGKLPAYDPDQLKSGYNLISSEYQRDMPSVKTTIYVHSIQLAHRMREANAIEVLYHVNGILSECSRSNIFFVREDGRIITPATNLLRGITRKRVIQILSDRDIVVEERDIHYDEIAEVSECFITSSTKTILPIVRIDDSQIGSGKVGDRTVQLYDWFQAHVRDYIEAGKVNV